MVVGIPREIKVHEYRVGLTPAACAAFVAHGHRVLVESGAGQGAGFGDDAYRAAGAVMVTAGEAFAADMVVKVKEPQPSELGRLRSGQILFTYLHLAADPELCRRLRDTGVTAIAYETIERDDGGLPCLMPMSQIAGRLAVQAGARFLERAQGGRGVLLAGVPGVPAAEVLVLGAGVAGQNACQIAAGIGARVTIADIDVRKLGHVEERWGNRVTTLFSTPEAIDAALMRADLVIGAVLVTGEAAPKLIRREQLARMRPGAVIVDVAIDQGGCAETSHPTTHDAPVFTVDGVVHYCVANMPGAVALTSTHALVNATLPYGLALATEGPDAAMAARPELRRGLNLLAGEICHPGVAKSCSETWRNR